MGAKETAVANSKGVCQIKCVEIYAYLIPVQNFTKCIIVMTMLRYVTIY